MELPVEHPTGMGRGGDGRGGRIACLFPLALTAGGKSEKCPGDDFGLFLFCLHDTWI